MSSNHIDDKIKSYAIQWYPGHMTKAKRMMQENISLIDLIIELVDARAPISSRNPDIDELGKNKSRIILLNKSDLADARANKEWMDYFRKKGFHVVEINAKNGSGVKSIHAAVQEACKEKLERDRKRGIINRPVRAMVVGIPNVGKSTFINAFAGKACAKTGNKPGVTKGKQWIKLNKGLELLDTPGILWHKFENQEIGLKLAFIGSINDEILLTEELALELIRHLMLRYGKNVAERYDFPADVNVESTEAVGNTQNDQTSCDSKDSVQKNTNFMQEEVTEVVSGHMDAPLQALCHIAKNRRCLKKGEELDLEKAAGLLLDDYRSGKLGRITLEWPEEYEA